MRVDNQKIELDSVLAKPSKVAILMNRNCASSCESLLFWAKESDKTILLGENSGGYVGYGEIETSTTPNFNFLLGCTMTRYEKQRQFEAVGIPPTFYLKNDKDWVKQAVKLLKN
jgi:C-terminal processing protease CtpA/Prc